MHLRKLALLFIVSLIILPPPWPAASTRLSESTIPTPTKVLGFTPGDDRKLASWNQVVDYFTRLDQASDRVKFEELGRTTMDRPFVMATISSPENLAKLEEYKQIQSQLADPRTLGVPASRDRKAADLIARGKTIVLITCGIHSTEVGSYLSSMLIAHRLASSNAAEIQNVLNNTITLLVPSLNPDGVDIVKNWYDKTLGTPYEGTDPPELYHKYTGHDNNRDWYAFTQVETQLTVDRIHNVWHPQIVHDIHQQGAFGSRLFLPPYMQPVEPNVPKQIVAASSELGNWMANEMRVQGFQGITANSTYDAWSPSRAYSHYHGGVRILSETASARIATPLTLKFDELTPGTGYDPRKLADNFGPVWQGGEWHLRDITNYMATAAFLLLRHAAANREHWLSRFYAVGKEAVRPRKPGELFAIVIPESTHREELLSVLGRAGVEFDEPLPFVAAGIKYPADTPVIRLDQPYGSFAKAILEKQRYPNLRDSAGHPIPPYDATAHTLSLLMGVEARFIYQPFRYKLPEAGGMNGCCGYGVADQKLALYRSHQSVEDEGWTRWVLEQEHYEYSSLVDAEIRAGALKSRYNFIILPDQSPRNILNGYRAGSMPAELTGGLGGDGIQALREFVEEGGTLVCLNRASELALEQFKLPVRNVVAGLPRTEFYVPGSILRIELDKSNPLSNGMTESIAWAENSPVFEVLEKPSSIVPAANVRVIAWYPRDKEPLLSGWLLGGNRIKGKAALIEVRIGQGRLILFGFRPLYRAQSLATYPLFFGAIATR